MIQAPGDYPRVVSSRDKHSSLLQTIANYDRKNFIAFGLSCIVVEHLTHNTKVVGLNPFTANGRCEMVKKQSPFWEEGVFLEAIFCSYFTFFSSVSMDCNI